MCKQSDRGLDLIRNAVIGELGAINEYENDIAVSDVEEVNEIWEKILEDEKMHYKILTDIIRRYDPGQCKMYQEVQQEYKNLDKICIKKYRVEGTENIANHLRDDIQGENKAIIMYQNILCNLTNKEVCNKIKYILLDEKEHVELLNKALESLRSREL